MKNLLNWMMLISLVIGTLGASPLAGNFTATAQAEEPPASSESPEPLTLPFVPDETAESALQLPVEDPGISDPPAPAPFSIHLDNTCDAWGQTSSLFWTQVEQLISGTTYYKARKFYNGLGQLIQSQEDATLGTTLQTVVTDTTYNDLGLVETQTVPYASGVLATGHLSPISQLAVTTVYDELGLVNVITQPDATTMVMNYNIHLLGSQPTSVTYSQDANGNISEAWQDAMGRLVKSQGAAGPAVSYTYDPADHLTSALYGSAQTQISYDIAGRKLTLSDPDMGVWTYQYDALSNLTRQTDARGQRICLYYDGLNRLTGKHYRADDACPTSPTYNVSYGYDAGTNGIGQRTSMSDASGSTAWTYDLRGQVTGESRTISGVNYLTSWTYNSAGLVASQTYPGGEVVTSTYLPQMKLASLTGSNTYLVSASYDAAGRLSSRSLGNTLTQSFGYYGWNEKDENISGNLSGGGLKSIQTGTLQNLQYTHDAIGNILTINDLLNSQVQTFAYDDLNRLTSAAAAGGQNGVYSETYTYNTTTGNLASKGSTVYGYNDSAHDHAVTHLDSVLKYIYDANGNQTQRNGNTLTYDAENRLVGVSGGVTAIFVYDGDGNRVQGTVNGVTTVYVNSSYEVSGGVSTSYYLAGGQRIALRKSGVVSYILPDHLGSTMLTTNSSGVRTSEQWYKAFGEERYTYGSLPTDRQYTGQDHETGLDLYFYNARWYDDSLGRFISADTIVPQPGNPKDWDRYAYTYSNPVIYTDPSGHCGLLCAVLIPVVAIFTMVIIGQSFEIANTPLSYTPIPVPSLTPSATGPTPTPTITSTPAPTSTNMNFDDYSSTAIQGAEDFIVDNGEDIFDYIFEPGPMIDPSLSDLFVGFPKLYPIAEGLEKIGNGIWFVKEEYKRNYIPYNMPTQALQTQTATIQPTRTATPRPPWPSPTPCYTTPTSTPY